MFEDRHNNISFLHLKRQEKVFFVIAWFVTQSHNQEKKEKHKRANNFFSLWHLNFSYQYKRHWYRSQHVQLSVMFFFLDHRYNDLLLSKT